MLCRIQIIFKRLRRRRCQDSSKLWMIYESSYNREPILCSCLLVLLLLLKQVVEKFVNEYFSGYSH